VDDDDLLWNAPAIYEVLRFGALAATNKIPDGSVDDATELINGILKLVEASPSAARLEAIRMLVHPEVYRVQESDVDAFVSPLNRHTKPALARGFRMCRRMHDIAIVLEPGRFKETRDLKGSQLLRALGTISHLEMSRRGSANNKGVEVSTGRFISEN